MYSVLNRVNSVERNIMTVEDPVEYQLPGVTQVAINRKAGSPCRLPAPFAYSNMYFIDTPYSRGRPIVPLSICRSGLIKPPVV